MVMRRVAASFLRLQQITSVGCTFYNTKESPVGLTKQSREKNSRQRLLYFHLHTPLSLPIFRAPLVLLLSFVSITIPRLRAGTRSSLLPRHVHGRPREESAGWKSLRWNLTARRTSQSYEKDKDAQIYTVSTLGTAPCWVQAQITDRRLLWWMSCLASINNAKYRTDIYVGATTTRICSFFGIQRESAIFLPLPRQSRRRHHHVR